MARMTPAAGQARWRGGRRARLLAGGAATLLAAGLAAGCVAPGGADAGESCTNQLRSFNGAGDPFFQAAVAPAAPAAAPSPPTYTGDRRARNTQNFGRGGGGAPAPAAPPAPAAGLEATLSQENADLDAVQIAFDALLYCRWIEARTIRAELAARRVPRATAEQRMAALRARLQRDLARAQEVLDALDRRAVGREQALEAAAPGLRTASARARNARGARQVVAAATVPLRLRPEGAAPEIGRVAAGQAVTVRPAQAGFALVEGQGGLRGYAPTGAFQIAEPPAPRVAEGRGGPVRLLAASNIAKRDNFAESLGLAREAAVSGFELGA